MKIPERLANSKSVGIFANFIETNSPTLVMIGGLGLMGCALVAAFKASRSVSKAKDEFDQAVEKVASEGQEMAQNSEKMKELKTQRNIKYILAYRWVLLFGFSSAGMFILSNYLNGAKIAGLTALAAWQQDKIKAMANNAKDMLSKEEFKNWNDKNFEDMLVKTFQSKDGPIYLKTANKTDPFFAIDMGIKDRLLIFQANEEEMNEILKKAEDQCARNHSLAAWTLFEDFFGLAPDSDIKGYWGPRNPFKAKIVQRPGCGQTWKHIELENLPLDGYAAGIPNFNK